MSILGNKSATMGELGNPLFREFKKQASFFLKEKIKTARLALTDVTPAQLLTEEALNGNQLAPDTKIMGIISRAAFEVDDYWRIVDVLHTRLVRFDRTNWRVSYKAIVILEHLLTHGPESVAEEFQGDRDVIREMESFQYIDERGFNWGLTVRQKSERVQKLLERGPLLKEERQQARKLSRGIQGFGSFCNRSSSAFGTYGRSNSAYNEHGKAEKTWINGDDCGLENSQSEASLKENMIPPNAFVGDQKGETEAVRSIDTDHPFNNLDHHTTASLLSSS